MGLPNGIIPRAIYSMVTLLDDILAVAARKCLKFGFFSPHAKWPFVKGTF